MCISLETVGGIGAVGGVHLSGLCKLHSTGDEAPLSCRRTVSVATAA